MRRIDKSQCFAVMANETTYVAGIENFQYVSDMLIILIVDIKYERLLVYHTCRRCYRNWTIEYITVYSKNYGCKPQLYEKTK